MLIVRLALLGRDATSLSKEIWIGGNYHPTPNALSKKQTSALRYLTLCILNRINPKPGTMKLVLSFDSSEEGFAKPLLSDQFWIKSLFYLTGLVSDLCVGAGMRRIFNLRELNHKRSAFRTPTIGLFHKSSIALTPLIQLKTNSFDFVLRYSFL